MGRSPFYHAPGPMSPNGGSCPLVPPCVPSPPARVRPTCFLQRVHPHAPRPHIDRPDALNTFGLRVAAAAGRRRRGVATWGVQSAGQQAQTGRRVSRALSASLGLPAECVCGARHAPTTNAEWCRASADLRPPLAHWPPHSGERSDQLRHVGPLRGPRRMEVSVLPSQGRWPHPAAAWVLKLPG